MQWSTTTNDVIFSGGFLQVFENGENYDRMALYAL